MPTEVAILPRIDSRRCVRSRCNVASCERCVVACPADALDNGRPPRLAADACTGCMLCAAECPADAISPAPDALPDALRVGLGSDDVAIVGCGKRSGGRHDAVVPCVGAIDEASLLTLILSEGPQVRIDATRCARCPAVAGAEAVRRRLTRCQRRAGKSALRSVEVVSRPRDLPPPGRRHDRREFFRLIVSGLAGAAHDVAFGAVSPEAGEREPAGSAQRRLAAALSRHNAPVAGDLLFEPVVATHCSVCRCCAAVCPTGALRRVKVDGRRRLEIEAAACTGCGACVEFCPDAAIAVAPRGPSGSELARSVGEAAIA